MSNTLKSSIFTISLLFLGLITLNVTAQKLEPLQLKAGLLEGINESNYSYKLIEFNTNGKHRIFSLSIVNGFTAGKLKSFTDNDINCNTSECIINIINDKNVNENTRLIITPYLDSHFNVIENYTNNDGQVIYSEAYQLRKQKNKSTVREFIDMYKERIDSLKAINKDDIYGFWLGILNIDGKPELMTLEIHPNDKSHLVRFINGNSVTHKTSFSPSNIRRGKDIIEIQTENITFANKILIHKSDNAVLEGYMYSSYKNATLGKGMFRLYRMKEN